MNSSNSSLNLTDNDELDIDTCSSSGESHSSGYESCDNCTSEIPIKPTSKAPTETMVFKSTDSLCDNLDYIISMPELCDVKFLVGQNKFAVHGVKAILATRSRVLYQCILQGQRKIKDNKKIKRKRPEEKLTIEMLHYDEDVFRRFISFVHCGKVKVDLRSVIGLYCAAVEFEMKDLKKACWDFFMRSLINNRETLTNLSVKFNNHKGIKFILNKLYFVES